MVKKDVLEKILETLQKAAWGMTIEEIASATGLHRNTVSKYMGILEDAGFVVKRQIGKYTFWLPWNVFMYHQKRLPERFLRTILAILNERPNFDPFNFGREVAIRMLSSRKMLVENFLKAMRKKVGVLKYFMGVFIPTIVPGLSFSFNEFKLSDDKIIISVAGGLCMGNDRRLVCEFIRGYIAGVLDYLGVPYEEIRLAPQEEKANVCEFIIGFEMPIGDLMIKTRKTTA